MKGTWKKAIKNEMALGMKGKKNKNGTLEIKEGALGMKGKK